MLLNISEVLCQPSFERIFLFDSKRVGCDGFDVIVVGGYDNVFAVGGLGGFGSEDCVEVLSYLGRNHSVAEDLGKATNIASGDGGFVVSSRHLALGHFDYVTD